jgi:hypothetical protein
MMNSLPVPRPGTVLGFCALMVALGGTATALSGATPSSTTT